MSDKTKYQIPKNAYDTVDNIIDERYNEDEPDHFLENFQLLLEEVYQTEAHPKSDALFDIAYEAADGYPESVLYYYDRMANLLT